MIRKNSVSLTDTKGNQCISVVRAIVSSIETLLGPDKSLKCCQSNGTSVITGSASKVLEYIDVEHPVGFIMNDVCQSFQKQFGCGCTTMICLIGYWAKPMQELLEMGISSQVISVVIDEGFEEFKKVFENSSISLKSLEMKENCSQSLMRYPLHNLPPLEKDRSQQEIAENDKKRPNTTSDNISANSDNVFYHFEQKKPVGRPVNDEFGNHIGVFNDNTVRISRNVEVKQTKKDVSKSGRLQKDFKTPDCNFRFHSQFYEIPLSCHSETSNHDLSIDEFEDCFDNVIEKVDNKKMKENYSKRILCDSSFMTSPMQGNLKKQLTLNPCLMNNELLSKSKYKVNVSKINLRSRHLVKGQCNDFANSKNNMSIMDLKQQTGDEFIPYLSSVHSDNSNKDERAIFNLARNLSHGREEEMEFALEIFKRQNSSLDHNKSLAMITDNIAVESVIGPPRSQSCVLDGVVVPLSRQNHSILSLHCCYRRLVMLVNGDITFNYSHTGFKTPVKTTRVFGKDDFGEMHLSERNNWTEKVRLVVKDLNVGVVISRGSVDVDLRCRLQDLNVVVLENLNHHQLEMISKMTKTPVMCYPVDMESCDLGEPVTITACVSGISLANRVIRATKNICDTVTFGQIFPYCHDKGKDNCMIQTFLICGPVPDLVAESKLKFWNCVHRLRNMFDDDRVLPGGGELELRCIKRLNKIKESYSTLFDKNNPSYSTSSQPICSWIQKDCVTFQPLIYEALMKGLREYISRVKINTGGNFSMSDDNTSDNYRQYVFDNYSTKIEGWRRAIRVVKLLLCSEYNIVTGI